MDSDSGSGCEININQTHPARSDDTRSPGRSGYPMNPEPKSPPGSRYGRRLANALQQADLQEARKGASRAARTQGRRRRRRAALHRQRIIARFDAASHARMRGDMCAADPSERRGRRRAHPVSCNRFRNLRRRHGDSGIRRVRRRSIGTPAEAAAEQQRTFLRDSDGQADAVPPTSRSSKPNSFAVDDDDGRACTGFGTKYPVGTLLGASRVVDRWTNETHETHGNHGDYGLRFRLGAGQGLGTRSRRRYPPVDTLISSLNPALQWGSNAEDGE